MTSATAQAQPEPSAGFSKARMTFRSWRRTRPFWGGLLVLFSGFPIIYFSYAGLNVSGLHVQLATTAGASAAVIGLLLIALGISVWFQPTIRIFAGIASIILALISLPMANLGGFGAGLLPGMIGGALVCSWAPLKEQPEIVPQPFEPEEPEGPESKLSELMVPQPQRVHPVAENAADGEDAAEDAAENAAEDVPGTEGEHGGK